jgi:uroporphyrinogen decarboxylase
MHRRSRLRRPPHNPDKETTMNTQDFHTVPCATDEPDFGNLLSVLQRKPPRRPTLFEFFLNDSLYEKLAGCAVARPDDMRLFYGNVVLASRRAGYDYATIKIPDFLFAAGTVHKKKTRSINDGAVIADRASFERYVWPDPQCADYAILEDLKPDLPAGMKWIVHGPGGVLENVIKLVGYENLCYLIADDRRLAMDIFAAVGSRLVEYYRRAVAYEAVGAIIGNDDWGFKTQTMLPPDEMREFVFPWHRQLVAVAHAVGKPAILHSCGQAVDVMDDIVDSMRYDGKHSYEDAIMPVEDAYDRYHDRIAILGGIDLDFVCRSSPSEIYARSRRMLERAERDGGYGLGTGNSVPSYVPDENYFAMIRAALDRRRQP